jgi:methyl-accepting chemotaxis protein
MRLGRKISLASAGMVALLICALLLSVWAMHRIGVASEAAQLQGLRMSQAQEVHMRVVRSVMHVGNALVMVGSFASENNGAAIKCDACHEERDKSRLTGPIDKDSQEFARILRTLLEASTTEQEKSLVSAISQKSEAVRTANAEAIDLWKQAKIGEAGAAFMTGSVPAIDAVDVAIEKLVEYRRAQVTAINRESAKTAATAQWMLLILVALAAVTAIPLGLLMARDASRPIAKVIEHLDAVGRGDVSREVPSHLAARRDEAGDLAKATQQVITSLRPMIRKVADGVQTLSASSTELSSVSGQMSTGSRQTSERADAVAAAAEEMSASMHTLTSEMAQATSNLTSVAGSTEEMTATIGEIAANSEKARRITMDATRQATQVSDSVGQLGQAAQRIGKVTETISNISAQTNLLALNATIEAARAGAAGKGFAVVANEIKDLAQQTAKATEDIKDKVTGIQSSTSQTIVDIGSISQTIRDVSEIVSSIATAIEEQAAVTRDIAGNIAEASSRVQNASDQVTQSSHVSTQIAEDISTVTEAASQAANGSTQVSTGAVDLSKLAEALRHTVEQFKL